MSTVEKLGYVKAEAPAEIPAEAFEKGRKLVEGLEALQRSMQETGLASATGPEFRYTFPANGRSGYMVVVPSQPIERWRWAFKQGEHEELLGIDKINGPVVVTHFGVKGLGSWRVESPSELEFRASSPHWLSEDHENPFFYGEQYIFNPKEHQVAILDQ